ncbi:MAG: ChaN family lipoprotein [Pseudomonadota bacterium]
MIAPEGFETALRDADVVIIGEVHDNPQHHARQADLVAMLEPAGLAFEMVPKASEEGIDVFRAEGGKPGEIGPAIGWDRLGWPDWRYYRPIFEAAPDAYIAGGATTTAELRTAIRSGADAGFGEGAIRFGLDLAPDQPVQTAMEAEMITSHCNKLPRSAAAGMVEAQRLRDARFAEAVLRADAAQAGRVVLITGNGHARTDRGVPAYLRIAAPDKKVLSIGQIEVSSEANSAADYIAGDAAPFDFIWFSAKAERPDPCAAFN